MPGFASLLAFPGIFGEPLSDVPVLASLFFFSRLAANSDEQDL
jgi:hypothetical protein